MKDVQNTRGNFLFKIDSVGVDSFIYPIKILNKNKECVNTVATFSLAVSLEKSIRGINMSRLPIFVSEMDESDWMLENLNETLNKLRTKLHSNDAKLLIQFEYFIKKSAPISEISSTMNYSCKMESSIKKDLEDDTDITDTILTVEIPITTLCPCSKEISEYSAHNQRGYVTVSVRCNELIYIEEIVEFVESVASCEIYPVLKRVDEKFVTEKAYNNPRFVEDIVRFVAEKLYNDPRVCWFKVRSRHMESIHTHNAFAEIEFDKKNCKEHR